MSSRSEAWKCGGHVAPSILFLALRLTSHSRLTRPILLICWPKNAKNAKNTNVGPLKETIPLTKKKAPFFTQQGYFSLSRAIFHSAGLFFTKNTKKKTQKHTQKTSFFKNKLETTHKKTQKQKKCVRPQTDTIRLVSSKLVLRGGSRRPGRPF